MTNRENPLKKEQMWKGRVKKRERRVQRNRKICEMEESEGQGENGSKKKIEK